MDISTNLDMTDIVVSLLTVASSFVVAFLTVRAERKRMLNELKRATYFDSLKCMNKLLKNPILFYDEPFFFELEDIALRLEVYADVNIRNLSRELWNDISEKRNRYQLQFEVNNSERESLKKSMGDLVADLFEKEEDDFKIQNMVDFASTEKLANELKESIKCILRKG